MMQIPKVVWKLILVILIGCGGTFVVIGTGIIKTSASKYDLRDRWQDLNCSKHEVPLKDYKVGISYQLMPTSLDREYEDVPYNEGDFPNADYHYYIGPVSNPNPKDSATVLVCSKCIELKNERKAEIKSLIQELNTSIDAKAKILQTSINLRAFRKYYRYPRRRKRMPLVIVANNIVNPEMRLIKYRKRALILDFSEIHEKGRTTYLEFKRFELKNKNNLDLHLYVSFEYKVENVSVDIEFIPQNDRWKIAHYEIHHQ